MQPPAIPEHEPARLKALRDLTILDTPPEERFDRLTRLRHRSEQGEFSVTMSCGIAVYQPGEARLDLDKIADDALYEAKRGGRNKVVLAQKEGI